VIGTSSGGASARTTSSASREAQPVALIAVVGLEARPPSGARTTTYEHVLD
jgi:hypothetical protein